MFLFLHCTLLFIPFRTPLHGSFIQNIAPTRVLVLLRVNVFSAPPDVTWVIPLVLLSYGHLFLPRVKIRFPRKSVILLTIIDCFLCILWKSPPQRYDLLTYSILDVKIVSGDTYKMI